MTERTLHRVTSAVALVALAVLVVPSVLSAAAAPPYPVWWTVAAVLGVLTAAAAFVRSAVRAASPAAAARLLWATTTTALLLLPLAGVRVEGDAPWVGHLVPTAVGLSALGWPGWRALGPGAVLAAVFAGLRTTPWGGDQPPVGAALDLVFVVVLGVVSIVAVGAVVTRAVRVQTATRAASSALDDAERRRSDALDRARWAGVVHDDVLAVLAAVQPGRPPDEATRAAAARALDLLGGNEPGTAWTTGDLADELVERVTAESLAARVDVVALRPGPLDAEVAMSFLAATTECVRNVVRHAGTDGRCEVVLDLRPDRLVVLVADSGTGFRPGRRAGRLGLRVAVRERVRAAGGDARWTSVVGRGTRVQLTWPRRSP